MAGSRDKYWKPHESAPPKDACLHLDPLTVKSQLPLKKPLPLTVEHLPDAPVGSVFGLYQSRAGLFSAASITSGDFLSLLDSIYHDCDIAQSQRLPLPREPKVEALHAWLPSLSLASLHPDSGVCLGGLLSRLV